MNPYIIRVFQNEFQKERADYLHGVLELYGLSERDNTEGNLVFRRFEEVWPILSSKETMHYNFARVQQRKGLSEKRTGFRFDCQCSMMYHLKGGEGDSKTISNGIGKLVDVSRSGMRIEIKRAVAIKEEFQVYIPMERLPVSFLFQVRVQWGGRVPSGNYQIGLQFMASDKIQGAKKT